MDNKQKRRKNGHGRTKWVNPSGAMNRKVGHGPESVRLATQTDKIRKQFVSVWVGALETLSSCHIPTRVEDQGEVRQP